MVFLQQVEKQLFQSCGIHFDSYNQDFLLDRIRERMFSLRIENQKAYLERLMNISEEVEILLQAIGINVSSFFRNPLIYEILVHQIFPSLIWEKIKKGDRSIRIWSAGCACGEEPYSIGILLYHLLQNQLSDWRINIFATDINSHSLCIAKNGVYEVSRLREVKFGYLNSYFQPKGDQYRIKGKIRKMVTFSLEDLASERMFAPAESIFGGFDLVFCRNVLMYFNSHTRDKIFLKLTKTLCQEGLLILGESEGVLEKESQKFYELVKNCRIFIKK